MAKQDRRRLATLRELRLDDPETFYRESRGLREFSLSWPSSGPANPSAETEATRRLKQMNAVAHRLLKVEEKAAGVSLGTPESVLAALPPKAPQEDVAAALILWWAKIGVRRGVLSPVAIGAHFLAMQVLLVYSLTGDASKTQEEISEHMRRAIEFAHAWQEFHFEVYGHHAAAVASKAALDNLATAGPRREARKAERKAIILGFCQAHWERKPSHAMNASQTADAIFNDVNASLRREKHQPYKAGSLVKVVADLIRAANPAVIPQ